MPSGSWDEWLSEDAIDMDFLEEVEAQHFNDSDQKNDENCEKRGLVMLECCGSQALSDTVGSSCSLVPTGALAALVQKGYVSSLQELSCSSVSEYNGVPIVFDMPCSCEMFTFRRNHFIHGVRRNIHTLEQMCNKVTNLGVLQSNKTISISPELLRREVSTFYHCLLCFISDEIRSCRADPTDETLSSLCGAVAADVLSLLVDAQQISHLQQHVTAAVSRLGNQCPSAAYHLFHLHLDIRWWSIAILHCIESTVGRVGSPPYPPYCTAPPFITEPNMVASASEGQPFSGDPTGDGHFTQCVIFVFWDLMTLMARRTTCSSAVCGDGGGDGTGLPCSCCYEVALAALVLSQLQQQQNNAQGFWRIIRPRLLLLSQDLERGAVGVSSCSQPPSLSKFPPTELKSLNPAVLFEMLLTFAKLFCYDERGRVVSVQHPHVVESQTLLELLQQLFRDQSSRSAAPLLSNGSSSGNSSGGSHVSGNSAPAMKQHVPEEVLRRVLRCCVRLAVLWEGEPKALLWAMLLWEKSFARNLDSSFLLSGNSAMQGLASVSYYNTDPDICLSSSAVREWVSGARQRCEAPCAFSDTESSWGLFLRLIGVVVRRGGHKAWLSVKGRVLSKLSGRRLSELKSGGLYNTACLLLTLALTANMAHTARLSCELLCGAVGVKTSASAPPPTMCGGGRLVMVLRAALAVLLMLAEADCDLHCALPPLLQLVAELVQLHATTRDIVTKREVGRALCAYSAAAAEVCCSSSTLGRGQHELYDEWVGRFVTTCCSSDLQQVLSSITDALAPVVHNSDSGKGRSGGLLVACIDRSLVAFLRQHSTTLTPPQELADAAATLTLAHAALGSLTTVVPASTAVVDNAGHQESEASGEAPAKTTRRPEFRANHKEATTSLFNHFLCNERINVPWVLVHKI
ncbi:Protein MMS22-like N-terminal [Trinorchestia longiramus]|nr:Protein MMS22-like N-terminal [Trinorchestia longiramus]